MKIGLVDVDYKGKFPNLPLMKISAYHKSKGDEVEFADHLQHYDKVYISRVFGDEYSKYSDDYSYNADEIILGGTGFAITVENGKEVYHKDRDPELPPEIEHIYPDYSLYPKLTKNKAYGFLTRGCCNDCSFCIVSQKEGKCSYKVADLSEFWNGQRDIEIMDANLLACKDRIELLKQLSESKANIIFNQGLDARFITENVAYELSKIKIKTVHFAFDFMKNKNAIIKGLATYKKYCFGSKNPVVYMLTNFDTSLADDIERIRLIQEAGMIPDVRIYRKPTAPQAIRDLQRWANNRFLYRSCDLMEYVPRKDGRTFKELYL